MRDIDVAELQSSLPTYLALATAGETIIIRDRQAPVLKLSPFIENKDAAILIDSKLALTDADFTEEQLALAADGIITLPKQRIDWEALDRLPFPK